MRSIRFGKLVLIVGGLAFASACTTAPSQPSSGSAEADALAADVRELITPAGLEAQAAAIVEHERPSGSPGEFAAIDHIVETLSSSGVPVEVHEYMAYASTPVSASIEVPGTGFAPQAITYSFSASVQGLEAPLIDTLRTSDPESDVYRFAEVTLVRERNRLLEALDEAIDQAERWLSGG